MSTKNTNVALSEGKPHFSPRHHDAVMVPDAAVMVRVRVYEGSRSIEMVCASAGVKILRVFPVVGGGTNHRTTEGGGRQAREGVRDRVDNPGMCAISRSYMPMYASHRT